MMKLDRYGIKTVLSPVIWIAVTGVCYFLSAGTTDLSRAWIYCIVYACGGLAGGIVLAIRVPGLANARGRNRSDAKGWDKILIGLYFFSALIITPVVSGLDIRNNGVSLPGGTLYIGILLYIVSLYLSFAPMLVNPFFEGLVRIQKDRAHKVVDEGPYAIVRHPGYLGMIIGSLALGFALGSLWGFVPVGIMVCLVGLRTHLEDKTLQNELPGYKAYTQKVRYRLVPFIW